MFRALRFVILAVVLAAAVFVGARWDRSYPIAPLQGKLLARPVVQGRAVAWLERREGADHLLVLEGRKGPRPLLSGTPLGGLAFFGDRLFTTRDRVPGEAELLSLDVRTGAQQSIALLIAPASALAVDGDWVCGLSASDTEPSCLPFVVAAAGSDLLWAVPRQGGRPALVSRTWGGAEGRIELLGLSSGHVYWVVRGTRGMAGTTTLFRCRLPDGRREVLAQELGRQEAVLAGARIAWTCYSPEAADRFAVRAVKAAAPDGANQHLIADWLPYDTQLLTSGGQVYASEREGLWRLGDARGDQAIVAGPAERGRASAVAGGMEYLTQLERNPRLVARGVSWKTKLLLALGL